MKILVVHPCKGFYGGAEEVVVQLVNYFRKNDHDVLVVSKDVPAKLGDRICTTPIYSRDWRGFWKKVRDCIRWADVICAHNFPSTIVTLPTKKPIVWYCNEPPELFTNWKRKPLEALNRWWVRKSGMKLVVADDLNAFRCRLIYGIIPSIIPYGVDYEFWSQPPAFERSSSIQHNFGLRYGRINNRVRILHVGTISPYKNQLKSICVLGALLSAGVDAEVSFVGRTDDHKYWKQLVEDYIPLANKDFPDFTERITWYGQLTQGQVRELFHKHDLLYHPIEGQGGWLVPFEAMCAGLPVIVEPSFSASDFIHEHGLGIISGEEGLIAETAILSEAYKRLDTEGIKSWVKENMSWDKFGEAMLKELEGVITNA